jgi:hypothetical protein
MVEAIVNMHEEVRHEEEHHMLEDLCILNNDVLNGLNTL